MDFIILKVNGEDLSSASHEHILSVFNAASDPIIVEVARQGKRTSKTQRTSEPAMTDHCPADFVNPYATSVIPRDFGACDSPRPLQRSFHRGLSDHNAGVRGGASGTDPCSSQEPPAASPYTEGANIGGIPEEVGHPDLIAIVKEEVVLRKEHPREIFGLTLSYSALAANDNSESEVYISAIEPLSVAHQQPGIKVGDQILQVNNIEVHSKAQVVALFQGCGLEVRLLLGRPLAAPKTIDQLKKNDLSTLEETEYSSVYDEVEACKDHDGPLRTQQDKDSGIGRGTDETPKTEESSECDSSQTSLYKSSQFSSLESCKGRVDPRQVALLMQHLALEYHQLQRLLQRRSESPPPRMPSVPPPVSSLSSSRVVPRMGTKLEPPQLKTTVPSASGAASNPGTDSFWSHPLTMELGATLNCSSLLSLRLDPLTSGGTQPNPDEDPHSPRAGHPHPSSFPKDQMDPCMTFSSIPDSGAYAVAGTNPPEDLGRGECHYYDVYDPSTADSTSPRGLHDQEEASRMMQSSVYMADHEYVNASFIRSDCGGKMEWVVKKRPDGSRYITRRPIRMGRVPCRGGQTRRVSDDRGDQSLEGQILMPVDSRVCGYSSQAGRPRDPPKEIRRHRHKDGVMTTAMTPRTCIDSEASSGGGVSMSGSRGTRREVGGPLSHQALTERRSPSVGATVF